MILEREEEMINITDSNKFSIKDAFNNKDRGFIFEINETFIKKYSYCIKFYVDRLRGGATAGVRGKTDVKFWNSKSKEYEYITELNENLLDYNKAQLGDIEGGEINIVTAAFLAQAYAEFLNDKLTRKTNLNRKTLVGFDTRYFSQEISEMITRVLAGNGFTVLRNKNNEPSPTPYNSLLTYITGCVGSLNVTASHNPADQNGVKPNNEKGHLDADDDLERFLKIIIKLFSNGKGSGKIYIAPLGENVEILDFNEIYLKKFIDLMMDDDFIDLNTVMRAMDQNWGFVIDGIGGTGGYTMKRILEHLLGSSWEHAIHIINADPDPNMKGIAKPDPTKPEVMEQSGLLSVMSTNPKITAGGTGDNDWDRFTSAIKISDHDIQKAKKAGLFVSKQGNTWLVQFTADQMYTFFGEFQLRRIAQQRFKSKVEIYSPDLDKAIKTNEINLSDCYIITTYPSSILSDYLAKYYGANLIYTSVGFKNIGVTVVKELEEKIQKGEKNKIIYLLGKEESGGNGFGFPKGNKIGPDGMPWLGTKDKDTSLNVLKLMEISAYAFLNGKTIVNLYSEMLSRLEILTFYERIDWYTRDRKTDKKIDDKKFYIARKSDELELPENASVVAKLLGEELLDNASPKIVELPNSYLWVKVASQDVTFSDGTKILKGEPIFNRVYDPEEKKPAEIQGDWVFMPVKAMKYNLKSGKYFTIFHAGEGPKISLYDSDDNPIYWTLIRPSGTEIGLIRNYNEVICDKDHPDPWLLAKFTKPIMEYFDIQEYYDNDAYLSKFNEKSLMKILQIKYY